MVFMPPAWLPDVVSLIPPATTVGDFVIAGRRAEGSTRPPLICAMTDKQYTTDEVVSKVEALARVLSRDLEWDPAQSKGREKIVVGILSGNTPDFLIVCWAIHRIGGTCLLLQPTTTAAELAAHMNKSGCHVLFSSEALLPTCESMFDHLIVPLKRLYVMDHDGPHLPIHHCSQDEMQSLSNLLDTGALLPALAPLPSIDTHREIAYLLTTSGTSGQQKLALITHANMIANIIQPTVFEMAAKGDCPRVGLGVLPLNHGYGLVTTHAMFYRGDTTVIHPSFNMQLVLKSIQQYRIERLYLVPPVVSALAANPVLFQMYDVSSIKDIVLGAAACSETVTQKIHEYQPSWRLLVGYGLTECVSIVTWSRAADILPGSSGCLLPSNRARLLDDTGADITDYDVPGELYLKGPARIPGYLGEDSTIPFTVDGWLPTGDIAFFRKGIQGDDHLFLVDRLKDMIKVKGAQVNPGEIEEVLRRHPAVADAAVIGIPDDQAGERPLAFVVAAEENLPAHDRVELMADLDEVIKSQLDELCWLRKQIRFIDELPRSASGKVLKKALRAQVQQPVVAEYKAQKGHSCM